MRIGILVVGIVLIVVGAVLLFVPVGVQSSTTIDNNSSTPEAVQSVSGFSLTGSIPIAVSWSSPVAVTIGAVACTGTCSNVSQLSGITIQTGTSGSFTLNQPNGGSIGFVVVPATGGAPSTNVTFKFTPALTTVGSILIILGIILLILGVVLKRKQPAAPAAAPSYPAAGSAAPPPPYEGAPPTQ